MVVIATLFQNVTLGCHSDVLHVTPFWIAECHVKNHTVWRRYAAAVLFSLKQKAGVDEGLRCSGIEQSM